MNAPTSEIFDRALLARRRDRAAAEFSAHDFLYRRAAEEIDARLKTIMRDFALAIDLGSQQGLIADAIATNPRVGDVVRTDISPAMLAHQSGQHVLCDEEFLPFRSEGIDLVVSGLALHSVNDMPGALVQIRRALRPDGLFIGALFGGQTLMELREVLAIAEEEVSGGISPRVAPFGDVRDYGALLQRAGFALPVTDSDVVSVTYGSLFSLMHDLRGMGASNVLNQRLKKPSRRTMFMRAAELYAERFPAGDGRIQATFEIIYLSGWAPHSSQQKPLKPGSAKSRLADALGVEEIKAGEKAGPGRDPES